MNARNGVLRAILAAVSATCVSGAAWAAEPPSAGEKCKALDFLIGDWLVTSADGHRVAELIWEPSQDHCYLKETSADPNEMPGLFGLMAYSKTAGDWSYTALQANGVRERFERGVWQGSDIRFIRTEPSGRTLVRLGFSPLADGAFREVAELSADGGRSWAVRYDLRWRRRR